MEPSDQDYRNLCKAYEEISKIIAKANEKRRVVDNFQVLVEIQNRIALPKGITLIKKGHIILLISKRDTALTTKV